MENMITLNSMVSRRNLLFSIGFIVIACAVASILMIVTGDVTFAAGNGGSFIGDAANKLLKDVAIIIIVAGLAFGIFKIVKGQTVVGIIIILITAFFYFLANQTDNIKSIGEMLYNLIFSGGK